MVILPFVALVCMKYAPVAQKAARSWWQLLVAFAISWRTTVIAVRLVLLCHLLPAMSSSLQSLLGGLRSQKVVFTA